MSYIDFFKQFCCEPTVVGAIAPSSQKLAERMLERVNFSNAKAIVEFGPGTGIFTRNIMQNLNSETVFFALELNKKLNSIVTQAATGALIYNDSATEISKYLDKHNLSCADSVISGLPWAAFTDELQTEILSATVDSLAPNGTFSTFAYLHGLILPAGKRFKRKLLENFSKVELSPIVWKNCPPAIVYWCVK